MRGGDVTQNPQQPDQYQANQDSTPSWFTNFTSKMKDAAKNFTAKIRNFKWSGNSQENPSEPNIGDKFKSGVDAATQNIKTGFDATTKNLEQGFDSTKEQVGNFLDKDVSVQAETVNVQEPAQQPVQGNLGGKRRTKRRKMRGGLAAYNQYTVAQTASPIAGLKTAEPTYMINGSLTNSLNGGKRRRTKGRRSRGKGKGKKTKGKRSKGKKH